MTKEIWVCTKCGEPGPEPARKLLDQTYGSQRCMSEECKREKRVFHKEGGHDGRQADHRG